jgi:hypothetical protein
MFIVPMKLVLIVLIGLYLERQTIAHPDWRHIQRPPWTQPPVLYQLVMENEGIGAEPNASSDWCDRVDNGHRSDCCLELGVLGRRLTSD